ncbi:uncharacterized protein BJ171DRAFT_487269 [Polychytrium aggregatum]|uniref:uncharacterized protein n=1 Tax=Polychytrium aggregatum TaxID=110093 RepID=UPI0022FE93F2|nr:uncharacterized protein BJ171DRAFT_487269 [Polychytrium aggregatum]KAI9208784.1 hypothetical protein BJ171DRAFT_487269 [Polychytrium aggregatum]
MQSAVDYNQLADVAARGADAFVETFYKLWDTQRHLLIRLYKDTTPILFNGMPFSGGSSFEEHYQRLPATVHEIQSYDCHPLYFGQERADIVITVTGIVKFGASVGRPFSETFLLTPETDPGKKGTYFIGSDCRRFV